MSDLTQLNQNVLDGDHARLWEAIDDANSNRTAGDAANLAAINIVDGKNTVTSSELSQEVVDRAAGDLRQQELYELMQLDMQSFTVEFGTRITNVVVQQQQDISNLTQQIIDAVNGFNHIESLLNVRIDQEITDRTTQYTALDDRVKRYEQMLSDITVDSTQITADNGEINAGAWTILSQARQWDLEIIAMLNGKNAEWEQDFQDALDDIIAQIPNEQTIISDAIEQLSNAPIIKEMDALLGSAIADIDTIHAGLLQEIQDRQTAILEQSQATANLVQTENAILVAQIQNEAQVRADALAREARIRAEQLAQEAIDRSEEINAKLDIEEGERLQQIAQLQDGLTQEIQHRIDGDTASITALNNYKVSNDAALANVMVDLQANITATTSNTTLITALDNRLTINETVAASAVNKAETALTETSALSTQVNAVKASIDGLETEMATKVDSTAFTALEADVSTLEGVVTSQGSQITSVSANLSIVDKLTRLTSQGKPLRDDPNFKTTSNLTVYLAQTGYTLTRQTITAGNPSGSTHEYRMAMTQAITGNGIGFYPSPNGIATAANKVFLFKMVLKAPVGSVINIYKNATGTPTTYEMLGNNLGTGKFETYYFWLQCGPTGTFSTAGHVAISQGTAPVGTPSVPFEAIVASYEVWDVTTVNDGIPKEWADKVDASATAITNLQSTVTSQGNQITSTSSAVTVLTNRVTTVENAVTTKADVSTVSALDSKVTTIDGKVTTNTNAITSLSSRVTTVEGSLANKVDASVLNNYSTTTQMNTAIASGITAYNASLRIGGNNVWEFANTGSSDYGTATIEQVGGNLQHQKITITGTASNLFSRLWQLLRVANSEVLDLKAPVSVSFDIYPVYNKIRVYAYPWKAAHGVINQLVDVIPNQWNRVVIDNIQPPTDGSGSDSFTGLLGVRYSAADLGVAASDFIGKTIEIRDIQLQAGTKATEFNKPIAKLENSIATNASAITTTQASVTALDGRITSNSNEITTLKNRVTTVEGSVATKAESSALSALDSRVTSAEGNITSQGSSITTLQNDLAVSAVASDNLLMKSNVVGNYSYGSYPHLVYTGYEDIVVGDIYTLLVCWEHKRGAGGSGDTNSYLAAYAAGSSQQVGTLQGGTAGSGKVVSKFTFVKNSAVSTGLEKTIRFFMINQPTNDKGSIGTVYWAVLVRGSKINTDRWIPSKYDLTADIIANSNAIQTLSSTVNTIDGRVTSNANAITNLTNRITTAEGNITSTSNALSLLTSRVTAAENSITSQSSQITTLNNNLTVTTNTANAALPKVITSNSSYKLFRSVLAYENNAVNLAGNIVIQTPITLTARMFKVTGTGYNYTDGATDINFTVGAYAFNNTSIIRHSSTNTGSIPLRMRLGIRNSTVCIILTNNLAGNLWQYPKLSLDAEIGYTTPPDSWQTGWSAAVVAEADLASYGITGIVEPNQLDMKAELTANASAITAINNTVTQQGNTITSNSNSITSLNNSITGINNTLANKAESSAVSSLDSRVTTAEGNITSLSNQTTTLNATLNSVVDVITIKDTRSTNELPNWYWTNYPQRKVIEFKQASVLGLTGMGTYVSLETTTQYVNASGGSIKQVARSGDELNAQHRYSVGSGTSATWSAWKPYIKDLTDQANTNATAISTLNTQVTSINGTITAQSTSITKLEASATISEIKVTGVPDALVGAILYGTETPNVSYVTDNTSASNKVIRFGDNSGTDYTAYCNGTFVAIDPNKLYRFKYRYRRVAGDGGVYLFIQCANAEKTFNVTAGNTTIALTTISSANYVVSNAKPTLNTWTEGEYFFKGKSTGASIGTGTLADPRTFPALAAFMRVGGLFNYNTGPGQQDLDYIMVEDYDAAQTGNTNAAAITALDTKVTTIDGKVTTQATSITQLQTSVNGNTSAIAVQGNSINGIQAEYTIKTDVNGLVAGIGLINSGTTSAVGVNADYFYVGTPANNKKPFMVITSPQTIGGVTYPAGTWIDVALIANATIGNAHIGSLDAGKITTGFISADRIAAGSITTDKLLVGGGNMLYGGLDNFQNFTTTPPNSTGSGTTTLATSYGLFGVNRIQHVSSAANSYSYLHPTTSTLAGWVRLRPNKRYILSAYVLTSSSTATSVILGVQPREGTTTTAAGGGTSSTLSISSADGWKRISVVFTPTGTDPHLSYYLRNVSSGITTYWDGFMLEEVPAGVSSPSPFTLGSMTRIEGGQIVTGTVTADKINVTELSAISANLGNFNSTAPTGERTNINGTGIRVYYPNGQLAIKIGF